jgi:hypothetical protein
MGKINDSELMTMVRYIRKILNEKSTRILAQGEKSIIFDFLLVENKVNPIGEI